MRRDYQDKFAGMMAHLILWIRNEGYQVVIGEVQRSKKQAEINAKAGIGIKNSLHTVCMAVDLSLFKDGVYLTETEDYRFAGEEWERMDKENNWGGMSIPF